MGALYRLVLRRKPNIRRETQTEDRGGNPWRTRFQMEWRCPSHHGKISPQLMWKREMTHVSGSRAQWQSTDLFLMSTSPVFVGIAFVCVLGRRYKWQIFPPPPTPRENNSVPAFCIPATMAVPDFLICLGTGRRLQSQKRSKNLLNVFPPKGPVLVTSRFQPLALFVTSRNQAQRPMKLSQSHPLNLQSFCMSWSKIVPHSVWKLGDARSARLQWRVCKEDSFILWEDQTTWFQAGLVFFSHDFALPTNFQHLVPLWMSGMTNGRAVKHNQRTPIMRQRPCLQVGGCC